MCQISPLRPVNRVIGFKSLRILCDGADTLLCPAILISAGATNFPAQDWHITKAHNLVFSACILFHFQPQTHIVTRYCWSITSQEVSEYSLIILRIHRILLALLLHVRSLAGLVATWVWSPVSGGSCGYGGPKWVSSGWLHWFLYGTLRHCNFLDRNIEAFCEFEAQNFKQTYKTLDLVKF